MNIIPCAEQMFCKSAAAFELACRLDVQPCFVNKDFSVGHERTVTDEKMISAVIRLVEQSFSSHERLPSRAALDRLRHAVGQFVERSEAYSEEYGKRVMLRDRVDVHYLMNFLFDELSALILELATAYRTLGNNSYREDKTAHILSREDATLDPQEKECLLYRAKYLSEEAMSWAHLYGITMGARKVAILTKFLAKCGMDARSSNGHQYIRYCFDFEKYDIRNIGVAVKLAQIIRANFPEQQERWELLLINGVLRQEECSQECVAIALKILDRAEYKWFVESEMRQLLQISDRLRNTFLTYPDPAVKVMYPPMIYCKQIVLSAMYTFSFFMKEAARFGMNVVIPPSFLMFMCKKQLFLSSYAEKAVGLYRKTTKSGELIRLIGKRLDDHVTARITVASSRRNRKKEQNARVGMNKWKIVQQAYDNAVSHFKTIGPERESLTSRIQRTFQEKVAQEKAVEVLETKIEQLSCAHSKKETQKGEKRKKMVAKGSLQDAPSEVSCTKEETVFPYHRRVARWWHRGDDLDPFLHDPIYSSKAYDPAVEAWIRAEHNFGLAVDAFVGRWGVRREREIALVCEIERAGEQRRGLMVFAFDTDGCCYHRSFTLKTPDAIIQEYVEKGFYELDFPPLPTEEVREVGRLADDGSYVEHATEHLAIICDPKNGARIRICRVD